MNCRECILKKLVFEFSEPKRESNVVGPFGPETGAGARTKGVKKESTPLSSRICRTLLGRLGACGPSIGLAW